jgi:hypothetical protein
MASSVFTPDGGRDQYHAGTFRAEDVLLTWTAGAGSTGVGEYPAIEGALVQEASWRCARQVSMLYEIGSPAVYYVGNRRSGTAQFRRVVGGKDTFQNMAKKFGAICTPANLVIDARQAPCGPNLTGGGIKYECVDATLTELGGAMTAEGVIISENMAFIFIDLYYGMGAVGVTSPV